MNKEVFVVGYSINVSLHYQARLKTVDLDCLLLSNRINSHQFHHSNDVSAVTLQPGVTQPV